MRLRALARRFGETIPLAIVLFVFWLIFTAKTNWQSLLLGAVVSLVLSWFSFYLLAGRLDPHLNGMFVLRFPVFAALLFWEIVKANWDVLKRVFAPSFPISPRIVEFDSYLESDIARTILANSITLTPGTVTIVYQWTKEGKYALTWTRLSCTRFASNQVRLALFVLAHNLGNFLRRFALPKEVSHWSLRSIQLKLVKIGAKVISHSRRTVFQCAEVAVSREQFSALLERIRSLAAAPT